MSEVDKFVVEASAKTPTVNLDADTGVLLFQGRSIPENTLDFYSPIYNWIDDYCQSPNEETILQMRLEYFNTSSSKCFMELFKKFELISKKGRKVSVEWFFEVNNHDMEEAGADYQAIIELPFNIIEVEEI